MFVKYSEGQIASVIENEKDLDEKQKKAFQEAAPLFDTSENNHNDTKKQGS
jgi:hypothetical protein